jgi:hypothetical protein
MGPYAGVDYNRFVPKSYIHVTVSDLYTDRSAYLAADT